MMEHLRYLRRLLVFAVGVLAILLSFNTLYYLNFDPAFGFLKHKQSAVLSGWYLPAFYAHIFAGGLVLLAGFAQFIERFKKRKRGLHRVLGYVYIVGILLFAAPGGLVMSLFIDRGPIVQASFVLQCICWIGCTVAATVAIRRSEYRSHERWMARSYALTAAAITLRLYIFGASWFIDLSQPWAYGIFAWLSWLPNLVVAEVLIRKKITSRPSGVPAVIH